VSWAHPKCLHRPPTAAAAVALALLLSGVQALLLRLLLVPPAQLQQTEVRPAQVLPLLLQGAGLAQHWVVRDPTTPPQGMPGLQLLVPLLLLLLALQTLTQKQQSLLMAGASLAHPAASLLLV
jgi:hypothetical protein